MQTLIVTNREEFKDLLKQALEDLGITSGAIAVEGTQPEQDEVTTPVAKKLLEGKGYRVSSIAAFNRLLASHGIECKKRGRDNWYKISALNGVPNKK